MTEKQADVIIDLLRELVIEAKLARHHRLHASSSQQDEISDEELDNVAGG